MRTENEQLRNKVRSCFQKLEHVGKLAAFINDHEDIVVTARRIGERIPSFIDKEEQQVQEIEQEQAFEQEERQERGEEQTLGMIPTYHLTELAETGEKKDVQHAEDESESQASAVQSIEDDVLVEIEHDTIVFRFQSNYITNRNVASSMSVNPSPNRSSSLKSGGTGAKQEQETKTTVEVSAQELKARAANSEARDHDAKDQLKGKNDWLFVPVPSKLVAGAHAVLYFNRDQSLVLKDRPHIHLHASFNHWELKGECERISMVPADVQVDDAFFFKAELYIPEEAYEMNFIFSDGEEIYDNNNNENYLLPVEGPMSRELWIDTAPERAEAEYLARKEAARLAAIEEEKVREELALERDRSKAHNIIDEIKREYENWTKNAEKEGRNELEELIWVAKPASPAKRGASVSRLNFRFNRLSSSLSETSESPIILILGHNQWKETQQVPLERAPDQADGEWWTGCIEVPSTAVVLNFVLSAGDQYDNNGGNDYCMLIDREDLVSWADSLEKTLTKEITKTRKEEEEAARLLAEQKAREREAIRVGAIALFALDFSLLNAFFFWAFFRFVFSSPWGKRRCSGCEHSL